MIIDISDILHSANKEKTVETGIESEMFSSKLGDFPITQKTPISLRIANRENRQLLISGTVEIKADIPCARCLKAVPTELRFDIDKTLALKDGAAVDEEMEETDYLTGAELDVERLVYAGILVNWPMKVLCRDDCKGICSVCGTDLNSKDCDCLRAAPDPRMAAFQDIFHKFKEV